jgi:erythromycin esterase-like protein
MCAKVAKIIDTEMGSEAVVRRLLDWLQQFEAAKEGKA